MTMLRRLLAVLLGLALLIVPLCSTADGLTGKDAETEALILAAEPLDENGLYYSKLEVATYLFQYGCLPMNYITKQDAESLGWEGGSVEYYLEGASIGGDVYRNLSGALPKRKGVTYYECDIDTNGKKPRGAKRIIYTEDGRVYYTEDHYTTFVQLLGEE